MSIRGIWESQTESIIDIRFGDAGTYAYKKEGMYTLSSMWGNMYREKHRQNFHKQQKHCSLFVLSAHGVLGKESHVVLANLCRLMAPKMEDSIFHVKGWFNSHITMLFVGSYFRMIRGYWFPSPLCTQEPDWGSGLGLGLAQQISRTKIVLHTPAKLYPFESTPSTSFAQQYLRKLHPPLPMTEWRKSAHGYVPRVGICHKK